MHSGKFADILDLLSNGKRRIKDNLDLLDLEQMDH